MSTISEQLETAGYAIVENVVDGETIERLRNGFDRLTDAGGGDAVRRRHSVFGVRNVFDLVPSARDLCQHSGLRSIVESVLGDDCFAIRATLFNKVDGANWTLGWHRDRFIAVKQHVPSASGFHAWSLKAGVWHVQPPEHVLSKMLAIRVHLDDCPEANGALRVIPGTHDTNKTVVRDSSVVCEVGAGGVLAIRPLLMHASSSASVPGQRRVIHIEYACDDLPSGVEWRERIR